MKTSYLTPLLIICLLFLGFACSGEQKDTSDDNEVSVEGTITDSEGEEINISSPEDISNAISNALRGLNDGEEVEAVDFRELKALLPERLAGLDRTALEGEKTGMAGLQYSMAKARYEKDDMEVDISMVDGAGFAGIVTGFAAWSMVEVDRETDTGYERTTEINGHKAFEKYDSRTQDGQLSVIIQDRFIVNIDADDLESDQLLRKIFKDLNLRKLEQLQ
jgi:hypothetical protein